MKKPLWIVLAVLIVAGLLCSAGQRLKLVNSDTLYLVALYRDIFVEHVPLHGYNLGPAPFLFPDLPLLALCLLCRGEVGAAFALYALGTVSLIIAAFLLIAREIDPEKFPLAATAVLCAALLFVAPLQTERYSLFAFYGLLPSNHGGALIAGVLLCFCTLRFRDGAPGYYWPLLFGFVLLSAFSDLFFVAQFVAPLCAAIALFAVLRRYPLKTALPHLTLLPLAAVLGKYLLRKLDKLQLVHIPDAKMQTASAVWAAFSGDLRRLFGMHPESFFFALCWLLATAIVLFHLHKTLFDREQPNGAAGTAESKLLFVLVSFAFCIGATAALPLAAGIWGDLQHVRYILPLYVLPVFMLALYAAWFLRDKSITPARILGAAVIVLGLIYLAPSAWRFRPGQLALPRRAVLDQLLAYAETHGLQYGWGNYWYSRPISVQSDYRLCLNEIHPEIHMNNWMNNPNRYFGPPVEMGEREWPDYNFILMNDLDRGRIEQYFGPPAARAKFTAPGDELEIYVYNRRADVALRNFLRMPAFARSFREFAARPKLYAELYNPRPNYAGSGDFSGLPVPAGAGITIDFDRPLSGDVLEISADADDQYRAQFYFQGRLIAELPIPAVPGFQLQKRFLFLPTPAANQPLDRVVLTPDNEKYPHVLSHLFIYRDSHPQ